MKKDIVGILNLFFIACIKIQAQETDLKQMDAAKEVFSRGFEYYICYEGVDTIQANSTFGG